MRALGSQTREALLSLGQRARFAPGSTIYAYGEPGASMLVIEQGQVEISLTARSGRRSILNVMGPGETLGEIAMLDRHPRSADACARTEVTGLVLHRADVLGLLSRDPDAMLSLMAELCAKVRNASEMFAAQSNTSAEARLARCMLRLGAKWGATEPDGAIRLSTTFSQSELGDFSGLARENVNRHMRAWVEAGLVVVDREGMTLADPDALRAIAEV